MADFRKKLLGLAGAAMAFAGIASAQTGFNCSTIAPTGVGSGLIRAEGQTELIPQLNITGCAGALAANATATVQVFLTSPSGAVTVTSATNSISGLAPGSTEAQLQVGGAGAVYYGTVSGGTVTFNNVPVAVGASFVISNVRVNGSLLAGGSGAPASISALGYVSVLGANTVATTTNQQSIALVINGLQPSKIYNSPAQSGTGVVTSVQSSPFGVCGSINNSGTAQPSFYVSVNENFAVSFKSRFGSNVGANTIYASGSESSNVGLEAGGSTVNPVASGTRIQIVFTNVPTGLNIFVPLTVNAPDGAVLTGISSASGGFNATIAATSPGSVSGQNYSQVNVANGSGVAYFEVTADSPSLDAFSVPVILQASSNAVVNQTASLSATVSYAPLASSPITGASSFVPQFATTATPITILGTTLCQTSLLFPFVTNQNGFETGIAISNTTKDPSLSGGQKPQSGICTLNFYGTSATNPTAVTAPNNNETTGAPYLGGESYAFTLTSALAATTGNPATFQGYIIAVCQFQAAHGFAYVTYAFPGASSDTMGYLALVLQRGSNGAESLGQ